MIKSLLDGVYGQNSYELTHCMRETVDDGNRHWSDSIDDNSRPCSSDGLYMWPTRCNGRHIHGDRYKALPTKVTS